jgi:hypothetical protein
MNSFRAIAQDGEGYRFTFVGAVGRIPASMRETGIFKEGILAIAPSNTLLLEDFLNRGYSVLSLLPPRADLAERATSAP